MAHFGRNGLKMAQVGPKKAQDGSKLAHVGSCWLQDGLMLAHFSKRRQGVHEGFASKAQVFQDVHGGSASGVPTIDCSFGLSHPLPFDFGGCFFLVRRSDCPVQASTKALPLRRRFSKMSTKALPQAFRRLIVHSGRSILSLSTLKVVSFWCFFQRALS